MCNALASESMTGPARLACCLEALQRLTTLMASSRDPCCERAYMLGFVVRELEVAHRDITQHQGG